MPPSGDHSGLRAFSPASVRVASPGLSTPSMLITASRRDALAHLPLSSRTEHWTWTIRSPSGLTSPSRYPLPDLRFSATSGPEIGPATRFSQPGAGGATSGSRTSSPQETPWTSGGTPLRKLAITLLPSGAHDGSLHMLPPRLMAIPGFSKRSQISEYRANMTSIG